MFLDWKSIQQNKPALFNWLVFTISLLLGLLFPRLSDLTASASFNSWMLGALVLYLAGLWLKHRAVYHRLSKLPPGGTKNIPYFIFLIIGHWIIMLAVLMIAEGAFRKIIQLPELPVDAPVSGWRVFMGIILSILITWFAFRPGGKNKKPLSATDLQRREITGDVMLITAVSIFSFVFWEKSLVGAMSQMQHDSIAGVIRLFLFLSFAYMLFYLPLRYLYLIDDHSTQAWRRLLFIFILILVRGLVTSVF